MRIIGGKDYYDSAAQFGIDTSTVLVRTHKDLEICDLKSEFGKILISNVPFPNPVSFYKENRREDLHSIFVIVGDKIWKGYHYKTSTYEYHGVWHGHYKTENHVFWTTEHFVKYLEENNMRVCLPFIYNNKFKWDDYFGEKEISKSLLNEMISKKISIIYGEQKDRNLFVSINGDNLKNYHFYKVVDAFQMHQRIEQWVSGVLPANPNETIEIKDDKIKIAKHGFDKFSFRKGKEK